MVLEQLIAYVRYHQPWRAMSPVIWRRRLPFFPLMVLADSLFSPLSLSVHFIRVRVCENEIIRVFHLFFFCTDDVIQFCYAGQCRVGGVGIIALTDNLKPFPTIHASIASVGQMAMSAHPTKSGIYIGWTEFSRFLTFLFVLIGFNFLSLDLSRYFPSFPYFWLKVLFGGGWGFLDWVISKVDSIPSFLRTFSSIFKLFNKPL